MSRPPGEAKGFGKTVQAARLKREWSQTKLAEEAGLSRPTIARIERGDDVSMATIRKVATPLGLTVELKPGRRN